jgi:hypothetical protein
VVILLAGHGSQQPDSRPDDPERFEPDGKEEIFLPADCGKWDGAGVKNAIVDYEFRDWLKAIRQKEASLWVIVDTCHSASMIRGAEVPREVPANKLVPEAVLRQAEEKARKRKTERGRGAAEKRSTFKLPPREPDLVAIYAAQSTEPTVELLLPEEGADRKPRGLLTYTLCKILIEAKEARSSLTYHELLQRVQDQYRAWDRSYPTPLIEGKDRNREVLGEEVSRTRSARSLIRLDQDRGGNWVVGAGSLHGLTVGSILKVFPPAGRADSEKPVGHVEILEGGFGTLQARVKPCAFADLPEPKDLPKQGRCELVFVNYGDQRLSVAVDTRTLKGEGVSEDRLRPLLDTLTKLAGEKGSLIEAAPTPAAAKWLLRLDSLDSDQLYLVPASGWLLSDGSAKPPTRGETPANLPPLFGPVPAGKERMSWFKDRLARIARVRNLLAIATQPARSTRDSALDVKFKLELLRFRNEADKTGAAVTRGPRGTVLYDEDEVRIRVTNESRDPIDITLLLLDSQYGISPLWPESVTVDNRVQPNKSINIDKQISNRTVGLEHVLVIAVKGKDVQEYARFGFLAQPSIEKATRELAATTRGTQKKSTESPLGELLLRAAYGQGQTRGMKTSSAKEFTFQVLSYEAAPTKRPAEKK